MQLRNVTIFLATLCLAPLALAQDTFTITGANPDGYNMGGVYVSPYEATITNSSGGVIDNGYVICDDFTDEVTPPESWTADPSTVGSGGAGLFGATNSADYNAVAWLADELMTGGAYNDPIQASELSFAIWTIFDPSAIDDVTGITADGETLSQAQVQTAVNNDITHALSLGTYTGPTATVWTPTNWAGDPGRPQEFVTVATPEASTLANLGVDLLALLVALFVLRRYRGKAA
jgi:hypothetical protein